MASVAPRTKMISRVVGGVEKRLHRLARGVVGFGGALLSSERRDGCWRCRARSNGRSRRCTARGFCEVAALSR